MLICILFNLMAKKITATERLDKLNWEEYEDRIGSTVSWFSDVKKKMNYDTNPVITAARFVPPKITKETISRWLFDAWQIMEQQSDTLETFEEIMELMKTEVPCW